MALKAKGEDRPMSQKLLMVLILGVVAGVAFYQARQAAAFRRLGDELRNRAETLEQEIRSLRQERDGLARGRAELRTELAETGAERARLARRLAEAQAERVPLEPRERAGSTNAAVEPARDSPSASMADTSSEAQVLEKLSLAARAAQVADLFKNLPDVAIPEMQLMKESDWMTLAGYADLSSAEGVRFTVRTGRRYARSNFFRLLWAGQAAFVKANPGQPLTELQQLKPYLKAPVDDAMLSRYAVVSGSDVYRVLGELVRYSPDIPSMMFVERQTPDPEYDLPYYSGSPGQHGTLMKPNR